MNRAPRHSTTAFRSRPIGHVRPALLMICQLGAFGLLAPEVGWAGGFDLTFGGCAGLGGGQPTGILTCPWDSHIPRSITGMVQMPVAMPDLEVIEFVVNLRVDGG